MLLCFSISGESYAHISVCVFFSFLFDSHTTNSVKFLDLRNGCCVSYTGFPLLPADCMDIIPLGYLTAEPGTLFLMGSNLTVYCHVFKCEPR